jgi:hypothetical protein
MVGSFGSMVTKSARTQLPPLILISSSRRHRLFSVHHRHAHRVPLRLPRPYHDQIRRSLHRHRPPHRRPQTCTDAADQVRCRRVSVARRPSRGSSRGRALPGAFLRGLRTRAGRRFSGARLWRGSARGRRCCGGVCGEHGSGLEIGVGFVVLVVLRRRVVGGRPGGRWAR